MFFFCLQVCEKFKENLLFFEYLYMMCEIIGCLCCMGNEVKCWIVSKDECEFFNGIYYKNKMFCLQVNICDLLLWIVGLEKGVMKEVDFYLMVKWF